MMVQVVVYSNQPILAKGLESLIDADPAFELQATCLNVPALREQLANAYPDLAVLDLTADITSTALNELQNLAPECKLILWTDTIAGDFALRALTIGVRGVLRKTLSLDLYRQCLHTVHRGELWFEKSLTESFRASRRVSLSPRESQLIALLARGLKNKEISSELGITEGTVKVYLSHLFQKSGAKDRFELALQGVRNFSMAGISTDPAGLRSLALEPVCR
jgi:two-component system, NarL family, nitrate/nitrite response regulator NarL